MTSTTTETGALTRRYNGVEVPLEGTYDIDNAHSTVEFVAKHLMVTKVRGRFDGFSGAVTVAEVPEESSVEVTIDAASIATAQSQRDEHLRSADFLHVEEHPTLHFKSTKVELAGDEHWKVTGDLTIRGTTRPVVLDVEFEGANVSPWGSRVIGFSASTDIDREDFGLTWNAVLETGGAVVGKRVRIELNVEASLRQAEGEQAA
ncbi:MAG TPA: YceI family protein [Acidimicrobiales bacterium]|nr:YceI family protein [Acidimicrobiales bacterium]